MGRRATALVALLAMAATAAGCGAATISDDETPQPFEGRAVAIGTDGSVLVPGVRGSIGDRGCQQSLAVARIDAVGRTVGRAGAAAGSIEDGCKPQVTRVVSDRQGRLVVYGSTFDPAFEGGEEGPSVLLRFAPSGRLDSGFGDGGVSVDPGLRAPFAPLPDGRLVDGYGTIMDGSETKERAVDLPEVGVSGAPPDQMAGLDDGLALAGDGIEVARTDENAEPSGYGVDGVASVLAGGEESVEAVIGLKDGAIVVLSTLPTPLRKAAYRPLLRRLMPEGEQDGDFGEQGVLDLASALGQGFFFGEVEAAPDGHLVVIGAERGTGRVVIARFTAAGRFDRSFGRRGVRRLDVGVEPLSAGAEPEIDLAVAKDGFITGLVGGSFRTPTRLLRVGPDGALDRRFGPGGVRRLNSL